MVKKKSKKMKSRPVLKLAVSYEDTIKNKKLTDFGETEDEEEKEDERKSNN